VVVLEAPDKKRVERHIMLSGGNTETVTVVLEPVATNSKLLPKTEEGSPKVGGTGRMVGFVVAGVGLAGMATFAVAGTMAGRRYDEIYADCGRTRCTDPKYGAAIEGGRRLDLIANVGLGVGVAGLATGALLIAFGGPKTASSPVVSGFLLPGAGGFFLRHAF
jgi:hypothetical protein